MKKYLTILFITLAGSYTMAQESSAHLGLGLGIDYGGFGMRYTFLPTPTIGLFGSLGYNLAGAGYNVGAQFKFPSTKRAQGYLIGMYGYNGVIVVSNSRSIFYGPSAGVGLELRGKNKEDNFWNFELLVPFRDAAFQKQIDAWKSLGVSVSEPLPIAFSIGYHFNL